MEMWGGELGRLSQRLPVDGPAQGARRQVHRGRHGPAQRRPVDRRRQARPWLAHFRRRPFRADGPSRLRQVPCAWAAASAAATASRRSSTPRAHRRGGAAEPDRPVGEPRHLGRRGEGLQRDRARPRSLDQRGDHPVVRPATCSGHRLRVLRHPRLREELQDAAFLQPGTDKPHPAKTSEEIAALAPNIEVQKDWKAPAPCRSRSSACAPSWRRTRRPKVVRIADAPSPNIYVHIPLPLGGEAGEGAPPQTSFRRSMEIDRRDLIRYGGTGLLTAVILLALVGSGWALIRGKSPIDSTLDNMRRMPLIGLVMADNSGVEGRMRQAIEDEIRSPTLGGLSRPYALIADLRRQYIVPALRAADDARRSPRSPRAPSWCATCARRRRGLPQLLGRQPAAPGLARPRRPPAVRPVAAGGGDRLPFRQGGRPAAAPAHPPRARGAPQAGRLPQDRLRPAQRLPASVERSELRCGSSWSIWSRLRCRPTSEGRSHATC